MDVGVQRTDSQRSQTNGPRVSFNRDVHVKRIGKRPPNEPITYNSKQTRNRYKSPSNPPPPPPPHPPEQSYHRELPANLTEEQILKEAELVIKQAARVKCKTDAEQINQKHKIQQKRQISPNRFNSLPTRKKRSTTKPIVRSVSDVSSKKSKRSSIFNLFSRRSDSNLNQIGKSEKLSANKPQLIRSKSDVGSSKSRRIPSRRSTTNRTEIDDYGKLNLSAINKPVQLSPIIENIQREDYFEKVEGTKEKLPHPITTTVTTTPSTTVNKQKENIPKDTSVAKSEESMFKKKVKDETKLKETIVPIKLNSKQDKNSSTYTSYDDIDFLPPSKSIGDGLKDTIESLKSPTQSHTPENMHSSQLPPEKLPLTKGLTVDGMVKRLSMERFSPPPVLSGPAFSYTRPSEQVVYSQVDKQRTSVSPKQNLDSSNKFSTTTTNGFDHHKTEAIDKQNNYPSQTKKSEVYVNGNYNSTPYRSYSPPEITKVHGISSPLHWKHNPRNLSDEDEGLGFEPRKYFEEDLPTPSQLLKTRYHSVDYDREQKSSSNEPPIVPKIRSVSPVDIRMDVSSRGRADGMDSRRRDIFNEFNDLSYRREALESKIRSRCFGNFDDKPFGVSYRHSPERLHKEFKTEFDETSKLFKNDFHESEPISRFHKLNSTEVLKKYSPDRTHLDMVSPTRDFKTSKYVETKFFDDGTGGVKETYERETHYDEYGRPKVKESRHRERLDSPKRLKEPEIVYKSRLSEEKYRPEYEPKSLESQYSEMTRSSPENMKRIEITTKKHEDHWHESSTLTRDKRQQRSFDKGDSGIENDFRKESFSGELTSKWRKRTTFDDIKASETFIKKEKRHTEETHPRQRRKTNYVYRERSIDDGSHFDPRLDKYPPKESSKREYVPEYSSLTKKGDVHQRTSPPQQQPQQQQQQSSGTMKSEKKLGGFEKVKKLFSSGKKKGSKENLLKENTPIEQQPKDRYMVKEEEMRSRYNEYRGERSDLKESKVNDISTRRRLSTPRASPLLKRTSSDKSPKRSPLAQTNSTSGTKADKLGWFKSLDRRSKKKSNEKLGSSFRSPTTTTEDEFSTLRSKNSYRKQLGTSQPPQPEKNLRFFGDTDLESIPSVSQSATKSRTRPSVPTLNKTQKYSQSAYHLDKIAKSGNTSAANYKQTTRSNSLQNLDDQIIGFDEIDDRPKRRHHSRSRSNLNHISESGSDTEAAQRDNLRFSSTPKNGLNGFGNGINGNGGVTKYHYYEKETSTSIRRSHDRDSRSPIHGNGLSHQDLSDSTAARIEFTRKPPPGPPKPARSMDRRQHSYSRERERLHDSSGTEGDSSLPSQRSVVYLHATTVGAIPQPYHLNARRRAVSREELRTKQKVQQPMTRTVSRSVSMLAPWKPKHSSDGYEINYSQEIPDHLRGSSSKLSTIPRKQTNSKKMTTPTPTTDSLTRNYRHKNSSSKDNLSIGSASKSGYNKNSTDSALNRRLRRVK